MSTNRKKAAPVAGAVVEPATPPVNALAAAVAGALGQATPAGQETLPPPVAGAAGIAESGKVAITFLGKASDHELIAIVGRIIDSMTGNAAYPAPFPALTVVTAARDGFVAAYNGLSRGAERIARRDQKRLALVQVMRDLALYVQHASQGDRVKLISSGYPLQKRRVRGSVGALPPPAHVRLRRTRLSNQLVALCDAVPGARSFQWRVATAQTGVWTVSEPATRGRYVLEDTIAGTVYTVQVRVFGSAGPSDWSDAATLMAA